MEGRNQHFADGIWLWFQEWKPCSNPVLLFYSLLSFFLIFFSFFFSFFFIFNVLHLLSKVSHISLILIHRLIRMVSKISNEHKRIFKKKEQKRRKRKKKPTLKSLTPHSLYLFISTLLHFSFFDSHSLHFTSLHI